MKHTSTDRAIQSGELRVALQRSFSPDIVNEIMDRLNSRTKPGKGGDMKCGCRILERPDPKMAGVWNESTIIFCPLHAQAAAMLEALKGIAEDLRSGWIANPSKRAETNYEKQFKRITTVIAKAEAEKGD